MYYNDRPDVVEGTDITKLLHLSTSHLSDGRVILHADFELDTSRKAYPAPEFLNMHLTDGATHAMLTPATTSPDGSNPAWFEPDPVEGGSDDQTSETEGDLTAAEEDGSTSEETDAETAGGDEGTPEAGETSAKRRSRVVRRAKTEEGPDDAGAQEESTDENSNV